MKILKTLALQKQFKTPILSIIQCSLSKLSNNFGFYQQQKASQLLQIVPAFSFTSLEKTENSSIVNQDEHTFSYYEKDKIGTQMKDGMYSLIFTCKVCNTRQVKKFSHNAYHKGVVLIKCDNCDRIHLIADNLKWFDDLQINLETILKEKSQQLLKFDKVDISQTLEDFLKKENKKKISV